MAARSKVSWSCYAESSALAIQEQCPLNHLACSCSDGSIDEHGLGKPPGVTPPAAFHPYVHPAGENGRGLLRGSLSWQACIFPSEGADKSFAYAFLPAIERSPLIAFEWLHLKAEQ